VADTRELILSRIPIVCANTTGIVSAGRNLTDVPLMQRPAAIVWGGAEQMLSSPRPSARFSEVQMMELSPQILVFVRADTGAEGGALMSLFRSRLVAAILADTTLRVLVTTNGGIRYEGCNEVEPTPESKEPRLELQIVFTYPLKLSDLTT
jgi:hypothetical protein